MTIQFSKTSEKTFKKKDVCVWLFDEDGEQMVDITENESEENDCSTAHYSIEETSYKEYEFTLVVNWSERNLPQTIDGEVEFRRMINKF